MLMYCSIFAISFVAFTTPPEPWEGLLKEPLISRNQTVQDVVRFVDRRLPELTLPATSAEHDFQTQKLRNQILEDVIFRGTASEWRDAACRVEWLDGEIQGPGYVARKLRFEALPGMWIPAILYEPEGVNRRVPVVMNLNGHEPLGKAEHHTQLRCVNLARKGMLALNVEWFGMGQLAQPGFSHGRLNQLDVCGASGVAPFYLAMTRGLDLLLEHPFADPNRVAVTGLSGGGWQSIMLGALDTRVTVTNPVAGFSPYRVRIRVLSDLGDSEQTPANLATIADYTHLAAMVAPRPLLLTYNGRDVRFKPEVTVPPLLAAARPAYALYGKTDFLHVHINQIPGSHNYEQDNREAFYQWLAAHLRQPGETWNDEDIDCTAEVRTAAELNVAMPAQNETFNSLAQRLYRSLPEPTIPSSESHEFETWRRDQRTKLASLVKYQPPTFSVKPVRKQSGTGWSGQSWVMRVGDEWQLPVIELSPDRYERTVIILADEGRGSQMSVVKELLHDNCRVLAMDPFYFGECTIPKYDYLMSLMINSVGERSLGIQTQQVAAVALWAAQSGTSPVELRAFGPRTSCIGLLTAALEPAAFSRVYLNDAYSSLNVVLTENMSFESAPELFCPDLIVTHDLPVIRHLVPAGVLQ